MTIVLTIFVTLLVTQPALVGMSITNAEDLSIASIVEEKIAAQFPRVADPKNQRYLLESEVHKISEVIEIKSITTQGITLVIKGEKLKIVVDWKESFLRAEYVLKRTAPQISENSPMKTFNVLQGQGTSTVDLGGQARILADPIYDGPTDWWDGKQMVKPPGGPSYWVKYEHDHNLPVGPYNPGQYNIDYYMWGSQYAHNHLSVGTLYALWRLNTIYDIMLALIMFLMALAVPKSAPLIVVGLAIAFATILSGVAIFVLLSALTTEMSDGWTWTKTRDWIMWPGINMREYHFLIGAWRDVLPLIASVPI
ncbi:MAG: hypothetical protein ACFFDI_08360 [Promethearchaeota archaeon]